MSTTPEITGRARGGGNGRPAAGTMHGKPVGSWESPSKDIGVAAKLSNSGLILLRLTPPVAGTADAGEPLAAALPPATAAACDPSADLTNYFSINWLAPAAS
jgi:hypothetical protein